MWFTEYEGYDSYEARASMIGRVMMRGAISEYSNGLDSQAGPTGIAAGPNSRMWFVETNLDKTGRVTL
jgi:hypothetical protein